MPPILTLALAPFKIGVERVDVSGSTLDRHFAAVAAAAKS